jgi:hypothetical protein
VKSRTDKDVGKQVGLSLIEQVGQRLVPLVAAMAATKEGLLAAASGASCPRCRRHNSRSAVVLLRTWLLARAALGHAHPPAEGHGARPGAQ